MQIGSYYCSPIYIHKDYRRQGISTLMMEMVFEYLRSKRVKEIDVLVFKTNTQGVSFWEKLGFRSIQSDLNTLNLNTLKMKKSLLKEKDL